MVHTIAATDVGSSGPPPARLEMVAQQASSMPSTPSSPATSSSASSPNSANSNNTSSIIKHVLEEVETAIDDDEDEYDYEALPENTSLAANLVAGAAAGIMVCLQRAATSKSVFSK